MAIAKPIQIVPLHDLAAAAPATRPRLTYRGGPMLPAVQVFNFFWGVTWEQGPLATLVQQINQFFDFGEIGDICAWRTRRLGSYAVQLEWSNSAGRCV